MIAHAVTTFGRLDCLVNNAGSGSQRGGIAEIDFQRFDIEFGVHVRGPLAAMSGWPSWARSKPSTIAAIGCLGPPASPFTGCKLSRQG